MLYNGLTAEAVMIKGHDGDEIEAYYAKPAGPGPFPGVVVIHHMPGFDSWTCEVVRKLSHNGYAAIAPHLFHRSGPGTAAEIAAKSRTDGGVSDDQMTGDVRASLEFLRSRPDASGKAGVIGFCSGGRHTFIAACRLDFDAAVDCWGGGVIPAPDAELAPGRVSAISEAPNLRAPLLGIFGNEDRNPDPEQVNRTEAILKELGKTYEFHRYDGAGHGFFGADRPGYRPEQAVDGWEKVFAFYDRYLKAGVPSEAAAAR
jgi:carboxymethylenebutenolidase